MFNIGDKIQAYGEIYTVSAEPYRIANKDDVNDDSAVDDEYILGEYIIPVDNGGIIYEHEIYKPHLMTVDELKTKLDNFRGDTPILCQLRGIETLEPIELSDRHAKNWFCPKSFINIKLNTNQGTLFQTK